jgi:hypothetical protein
MGLKLHPMSGAILTRERDRILKRQSAGQPTSSYDTYILDSAQAVLIDQNKLTDKWIKSINKIVKRKVDDMCIEDPEHEIGSRIDIVDHEIINIKVGNYGLQAICINENGWKYFFRSAKLEYFEVGDKITLRATVKSSDDAITFLSRPKVVVPIDAVIKTKFDNNNT